MSFGAKEKRLRWTYDDEFALVAVSCTGMCKGDTLDEPTVLFIDHLAVFESAQIRTAPQLSACERAREKGTFINFKADDPLQEAVAYMFCTKGNRRNKKRSV